MLPRVLIIAATPESAALGADFRSMGFDVEVRPPGIQALVEALSARPAIIAIDWRFEPDTAHQFCISLRSEEKLDPVPILALTAPAQGSARADALEAGANEAVIEPFHKGESLHRIQRLKLGPGDHRPEPTLTYSDIEVYQNQFKVRRNGNSIPLTPLQLKLLSFLVTNPGTVFSRRELLEAVWGDTSIDERSVTVCVVRLRRALTSRGDRNPLRNVAGIGYALDLQESPAGHPA